MKYYYLSALAFLSLIAFTQNASAAVIFVLPEGGSFGITEEFSVDVKIDSEGESINAAEATVRWPADMLEVVEVNKSTSVFNFWVEEPTVSSDKSSLTFIGGTAKGISGVALQIFKIKFKGKSAGTAEITISDAAVTASDGKGTNVLSRLKGASYAIGGEIVKPKAPEVAVPTPSAPQPIKVERPAVPALKLPLKPEITVPLYAVQGIWHNISGEAVALWNVYDDVTHMAVLVDQSPTTVPTISEKELATGKKIGVLEDGIWYIHVRFRNNIGWGPTEHYRIAIDTRPPLSFEVLLPEGDVTDSPIPALDFETSDALSGLSKYHVKIGDSEWTEIAVEGFTGIFTLPLQTPGKRMVIVKAFDQAGNSSEDRVEIEIVPIASPTITFVTKELFSEEENGLTAKGTALPVINVLLKVYRSEALVVAKTVPSDERGNWDYTFEQTFKNGTYKITAQSQDARGALSAIVDSQSITIKSKPIIQIGAIQLGKGGAAIILLLLLIIGLGGGYQLYHKKRSKLAMRVSLTESEITKIFQLLKQDIELVSKSIQTPTTSDDEYAVKRLQENIQKMEAYLKKGVEKINK